MIRSRDVILFVLTVWFLLLMISVTVWGDANSANQDDGAGNQWLLPSQSAPEYGAERGDSAAAEPDRAGTIARLREKLAAGSEISNAVPSVEIEAPSEPDATDGDGSERVLRRCAFPDDSLGLISRWPVLSIESEAREGARLYYTEDTVRANAVGTTSTTTAPETVRKTWLQLPQFPQPLAAAAACLPSEVIGVHTNGTLLFNVDVASYRGTDANTLIGYARDGYPIYGVYQGELDACGGYQHPTGYRYSLAPDAATVITCFTAAPQSINW